MKKIISVLIIAVLAICIVVAFFCNKPNTEPEPKSEVLISLSFENTISADKEYMMLNYGGEYTWFETTAVMKNYLDEECDGSIETVGSVFQVLKEDDEGDKDTEVIFTTHTETDNDYIVRHGFWVMDQELNNVAMFLKFDDAFAKVIESDYPKPHSRYCVLRKQVGPKESNPQYIFGNEKYALFVDAISGEVTDQNPSF